MKFQFFAFILLSAIQLYSCNSDVKAQDNSKPEAKVINPIPIDIKSISGLNLQPVTNQNEPERRLFQKRILRGLDLSVYVVSSETATASHSSYGIDEFLYLINGRARLNPENGDEVIYNTGDFFVAPKGFKGEWETQGGNEFLIELSVISTQRNEEPVDPNKTLPYLIDKAILSGVGIKPQGSPENNSFTNEVYQGPEIVVSIHAEKPDSIIQVKTPMQEQFI